MSEGKTKLPPLRQAFFNRLLSEIYTYLRGTTLFKDWDAKELYQVANGILQDAQPEIEEYLDNNPVKIKEADKAVSIILSRFVIPRVENLRI